MIGTWMRVALGAALLALLITPGFAQIPTTLNPLETYTWRYERSPVGGEETIRRVRMTWEEGQAWDKTRIDVYVNEARRGQIPGQPQGADPNAIAAWKLYYEQLKLWEEYVQQTCFGGVPLKGTLEEVRWSNNPMAENQGGPQGMRVGSGAEAIVAANQNKSLDQQTGEFFTFGSAQQPGQEGPLPPLTKDGIVLQITSLHEVLKQQGKDTDDEVYRVNQRIATGLAEREGQRLAYKNWLEEQKDFVVEAALEWGRVQQGEIVFVDGVQYELYSPAYGLPRGEGAANVVRVVTDNLSPYDLLNPDGSIRQPLQQR
jgi:hypothetical protein